MADVKQIEVNGVTYDIHDAVARTEISNLQQSVSQKVSKTGDTLTGNANFKNNNLDISTTPGSDAWGDTHLKFVDKNNNEMGQIRPIQEANGNNALILRAFNKNASGSYVDNTLRLKVNKQGVADYAVSHPGNFRTAIGAPNADETFGKQSGMNARASYWDDSDNPMLLNFKAPNGPNRHFIIRDNKITYSNDSWATVWESYPLQLLSGVSAFMIESLTDGFTIIVDKTSGERYTLTVHKDVLRLQRRVGSNWETLGEHYW